MENRDIRMIMVDKLQMGKVALDYNLKGSIIGTQLLEREIEAYEKVIDLLDLIAIGRLIDLSDIDNCMHMITNPEQIKDIRENWIEAMKDAAKARLEELKGVK